MTVDEEKCVGVMVLEDNVSNLSSFLQSTFPFVSEYLCRCWYLAPLALILFIFSSLCLSFSISVCSLRLSACRAFLNFAFFILSQHVRVSCKSVYFSTLPFYIFRRREVVEKIANRPTILSISGQSSEESFLCCELKCVGVIACKNRENFQKVFGDCFTNK